MPISSVILGTRSSPLAMWQARHVADRISDRFPHVTVRILPVTTTGDRDTTTALSGMGLSGVFTRELEIALLKQHCDIAVHSLKDVATQVPTSLVCDVFLPREDPRDALIGPEATTLDALPPGAVVGTSSLRRKAQLLNMRPDLSVVNLRGNVHTRLGAIDARKDGIQATVMASAGLHRLGLHSRIAHSLDPHTFIPAPAQGTIGLEMRRHDDQMRQLAAVLNDPPTAAAVTAERTFLRDMEGGCRLPLGAWAEVCDGDIRLTGGVFSIDGHTRIDAQVQGTDPTSVGAALATVLKARGADAVLRDVKAHLAP